MNAAFDAAAVSYDSDFTHAANGRAQRLQVRRHLENFLERHPIKTLLEVNCGTGEDALWLCSKGIEVTATDISGGMIDTASAKPNPGNCTFRREDMTALAPDLTNGAFDLLFSNFGGLNCLNPELLRSFFENAGAAAKPGGHLALVVMPKRTIWERLYFGWKKDMASAHRRLSGKAIANVSGQSLETWYYDPADLIAAAAGFETVYCSPIGLFTPPSYLENLTRHRKWLSRLFSRLDRIFAGAASLSPYADHYFILMRRS